MRLEVGVDGAIEELVTSETAAGERRSRELPRYID